MLQRFRQPWTDRRAELTLGALACLVLLVIGFMIVFVAIRAWPSFHANGLSWFSAKGSVYVSPIQYQAQWGLLKTAAAPLRSASGRIAATMGADVNISVIQVATQNALFASALIGVASLLACALATLLILRFVAQPIEGLKADALRIAAGDRAPPQALRAPREVTALRAALGERAGTLFSALTAMAMWFCGLSAVTWSSRVIWAFARDEGLPVSRLWKQVSHQHGTQPSSQGPAQC